MLLKEYTMFFSTCKLSAKLYDIQSGEYNKENKVK